MIKILFVYSSATNVSLAGALRKTGYEVMEYPDEQDTADMDEDKIHEMVDYIREHKITHTVSIGLLYSVAVAVYWSGIKYMPIIWDAPYLKPYTVMGMLDNIWYSVFDKLDAERMKKGGCPHVLYQPLAVDEDKVVRWHRETLRRVKCVNDISFIGNLYEENDYDRCLGLIPENIQLYFRSIMEEAVFQWDGINRIYGQTGKEIMDYINLTSPAFKLDNPYDIEDVRYFEAMYLIRKMANLERICVLNLLAEEHDVFLYTNSKVASSLLPKVHSNPAVPAGEPAAVIFAGSKINLNISLKGIEGGTPQRVMDILGAGGFALTSYCEETAEIFEEDKEIVMFRSPEELLEKVDYYLSHDKEREQIARAGHAKVMKYYTYEKKVRNLFAWITSDTPEENKY